MAYTYQQLQDLFNAAKQQAPWEDEAGQPFGSIYLDRAAFPEARDRTSFTLPDGRNVRFDPATGQFGIAQGDMDSGGIQRTMVGPTGTQDLGFEAPRSFGDKLQSTLSNAAPYLAGMAGIGLGAAYLPSLLGGGGAAAGAGAAGAGAASGAAGGGLGGAAFGAGLEAMPTFLGTGSGLLGPAGATMAGAGGLDAAALLGGAGGWASGAGGLAGTAAGALGASPALGAAMGGSGGAAGSSWLDLLRQGGGAAQSLLGGGAAGGAGGGGLGALGAAGLGALAGVAGNGDINSTQSTSGTSSTSLAPWLQSAAQGYVGRAQGLANGPMSNQSLDTAGGLLSQYATQGDPLVNQARSQQANVISGGMLGSNPYLDSVADNIGRRMGDAYATGTRAGVFSGYNNDGNSVLAKSGFGQTLGMADRNYADSLGSTMSNLYANNYNTERAAQDNASRGSLNFGQFGANNAQSLAGFGADQFQRPFAANQQFGAAINPSFGSSTTGTDTRTQNVQAPNNFLAGAGGAAAGAGLWSNIFGARR